MSLKGPNAIFRCNVSINPKIHQQQHESTLGHSLYMDRLRGCNIHNVSVFPVTLNTLLANDLLSAAGFDHVYRSSSDQL
jgi:hypothetical protein